MGNLSATLQWAESTRATKNHLLLLPWIIDEVTSVQFRAMLWKRIHFINYLNMESETEKTVVFFFFFNKALFLMLFAVRTNKIFPWCLLMDHCLRMIMGAFLHYRFPHSPFTYTAKVLILLWGKRIYMFVFKALQEIRMSAWSEEPLV